MSDVFVTIGDVVHFSDVAIDGGSVTITDTPAEPTAPTIPQLLAESRAAHLKFRQSDGRIDREGKVVQSPDYVAAESAIQAALNARLIANHADPKHHDPAWADDQGANNGVSSDALIEFFRDYLT